jgi:hypothetical protein
MPKVFQSLTSLRAARAAAIILQSVAADDWVKVRSLLQSIEPGETHVPLGGISPDVFAFYSPSYVIVGCSGTENWSQWLDNLSAPLILTDSDYPGVVSRLFADQATAVRSAIGETVVGLLPTRTLILMGHSRGGAVAQLLASIWGPLAGNCFVYTFGSSRAGDKKFADAVRSFVVRYENTGDPIPMLPTSEKAWTRKMDDLFLPEAEFSQLWVDAGQQRTLFESGDVQDDGPRATPSILTLGLLAASPIAHEMVAYRIRLTKNQPSPFAADEVDDPPTFNGNAAIQAASTPIPITSVSASIAQEVGMSLCAGTLFFKSLDRTFGWTETWYAAMSVSNMLAALKPLLPSRLAFLAPDCGIYWYRAMIVEKGQPRSTALFKLPKIKKGTAVPSGTVAGDSTAMTMDCIVGTLYSSAGSLRQEKWRGLPDAYLEEDGLSDAGFGALDIINAYLVQVKAAGLGIRRQTMLPTDKKDIDGIVKDANGNVNLTVTDHGILLTQAFEIAVRGRTLSNPMLRAKWQAKVKDANTLQLLNSTRFGVGSGGPGGTVTITSYGNDSLVNPPAQTRLFDFNQTSAIKTGRPSDLHHGKRSPVLRHR